MHLCTIPNKCARLFIKVGKITQEHLKKWTEDFLN